MGCQRGVFESSSKHCKYHPLHHRLLNLRLQPLHHLLRLLPFLTRLPLYLLYPLLCSSQKKNHIAYKRWTASINRSSDSCDVIHGEHYNVWWFYRSSQEARSLWEFEAIAARILQVIHHCDFLLAGHERRERASNSSYLPKYPGFALWSLCVSRRKEYSISETIASRFKREWWRLNRARMPPNNFVQADSSPSQNVFITDRLRSQ